MNILHVEMLIAHLLGIFVCEDRGRELLSIGNFEISRQFQTWSVVLFLLVVWLSPVDVYAQGGREIRVIEESAISYLGFLSKAEFDQRFPGQMQHGPTDLDSGWYVIYEHEQLNYYFGPILLESTGQDYLEQLTETVEAAVQQRPSITDYRLELSFEPSAAPSASERESGSENSESGYGSPPPPPPSNIWTLIRSIFGI
jgi:hypothetical protein